MTADHLLPGHVYRHTRYRHLPMKESISYTDSCAPRLTLRSEQQGRDRTAARSAETRRDFSRDPPTVPLIYDKPSLRCENCAFRYRCLLSCAMVGLL